MKQMNEDMGSTLHMRVTINSMCQVFLISWVCWSPSLSLSSHREKQSLGKG